MKAGSEELRRANRRVVRNLLFVTIGMFGFGFALVPLYDVICEITGIDGRTGRVAAEQVDWTRVDTDRLVTVQFVAYVNGLPWEFRPQVRSMRVHPGEIHEVMFEAYSLASTPTVGSAVPSLSPTTASRFMNKTECFCFQQQTLEPSETREMPVRFVLDPDLPREIGTVTLAYTFFGTERGPVRNAGQRASASPAGAK
jgi:cytochrome c oxidase assembly protein subunit 11